MNDWIVYAVIVLAGLYVGWKLLLLVVALLERRPIEAFVPLPVGEAPVLDLYAKIIVQLGYARFADPAQTQWRHTLKGAIKVMMVTLPRSKRRVAAQKERMRLKRPGDAGFVPSFDQPSATRERATRGVFDL